jgi:hypothetical protein
MSRNSKRIEFGKVIQSASLHACHICFNYIYWHLLITHPEQLKITRLGQDVRDRESVTSLEQFYMVEMMGHGISGYGRRVG